MCHTPFAYISPASFVPPPPPPPSPPLHLHEQVEQEQLEPSVTRRSLSNRRVLQKQKVLVDGLLSNPLTIRVVPRQLEGVEQLSPSSSAHAASPDTIHIFSLASGLLYERFLRLMMASAVERSSQPLKFWLLDNFLSPSFRAAIPALAAHLGCEVATVQYGWPEWLRSQQDKQRLIWGYKILFLDVLFPLGVDKVIYVDADQIVQGLAPPPSLL